MPKCGFIFEPRHEKTNISHMRKQRLRSATAKLISAFVEWSPIGKIAAHSAYEMFSWYKYLIVSLIFFSPRFLEWESFSDCAFS